MTTNAKHDLPGLDLQPVKAVEILQQASQTIQRLGHSSWIGERCQKYLRKLLIVASAFGKWAFGMCGVLGFTDPYARERRDYWCGPLSRQ